MSAYAQSEKARTLASRLWDDFKTHAADLEIDFVPRPVNYHAESFDMAEPLRSTPPIIDVPVSLAVSRPEAEIEVKTLKARNQADSHTPTCPHCWHVQPQSTFFDMWANVNLDNDLPLLGSPRSKPTDAYISTSAGRGTRVTLLRRSPRVTCEKCGKEWHSLLVPGRGALVAQRQAEERERAAIKPCRHWTLTFPDGSTATGTQLTTTFAQWNTAREQAGQFVSYRNLATGKDIDGADIVVLVDGKGTPLGGSFELPLSTIQWLGFEDAVQAAMASILAWRRQFKAINAAGDGTPWQPLVGCDDPFDWGDRRTAW